MYHVSSRVSNSEIKRHSNVCTVVAIVCAGKEAYQGQHNTAQHTARCVMLTYLTFASLYSVHSDIDEPWKAQQNSKTTPDDRSLACSERGAWSIGASPALPAQAQAHI